MYRFQLEGRDLRNRNRICICLFCFECIGISDIADHKCFLSGRFHDLPKQCRCRCLTVRSCNGKHCALFPAQKRARSLLKSKVPLFLKSFTNSVSVGTPGLNTTPESAFTFSSSVRSPSTIFDLFFFIPGLSVFFSFSSSAFPSKVPAVFCSFPFSESFVAAPIPLFPVPTTSTFFLLNPCCHIPFLHAVTCHKPTRHRIAVMMENTATTFVSLHPHISK